MKKVELFQIVVIIFGLFLVGSARSEKLLRVGDLIQVGANSANTGTGTYYRENGLLVDLMIQGVSLQKKAFRVIAIDHSDTGVGFKAVEEIKQRKSDPYGTVEQSVIVANIPKEMTVQAGLIEAFQGALNAEVDISLVQPDHLDMNTRDARVVPY